MAKRSLKEALAQGEFAVTCELIPGRGAREASQEALFNTACAIWDTGRVHALSVTDAPGGNPALSATVFSAALAERGVECLTHLSCKDRNRNQLEAELYALTRAGVPNVLCMTGDHPQTGFLGQPKPVFDLDSVTLVELIRAYNAGLGYPAARGRVVCTQPAELFAGAVISPEKWTEAEVMLQLYKAQKKVFAGAEFLVTQLCFDARKLQECLQLVRAAGLTTASGAPVPLIANVFLLTAGSAAAMHRGAVPGCYVSEEFATTLREERDTAADKGAAARIRRAAQLVAFARGVGYAGVHLGGFGIDEATVCAVLDLADTFDDWRALAAEIHDAPADAWWAFEADLAHGGMLSTDVPAARTELRCDKAIQGNYRLSRFFHGLVFEPNRGLNSTFLTRERHLEQRKGRLREHHLEHLSKARLYGCIDCGDCGLYACAYSCPMASCPKCQRNGACGGSSDGWCELYPGERYCIWYKAYHRLKAYGMKRGGGGDSGDSGSGGIGSGSSGSGEQDTLGAFAVPPNDWRLWGKSPWGATASGLDGYARRAWLPGSAPDINATDGVAPADDAPRVW